MEWDQNLSCISCSDWLKILCYECDQAQHQDDEMQSHRREVIKMAAYLIDSSRSSIGDTDEPIYSKQLNSESSYNDFSTHLKTDQNERTELAEINFENEGNKAYKQLKSFNQNNSFSKENRPRVWEYENGYSKPHKQKHNVRKSAEFTFSNFNAVKDDGFDDEFVAMSEQPYFSNRVHISTASGKKNSLDENSEYAKCRYGNTDRKHATSIWQSQRGRPRSQAADMKQARMKSELKEEFEKLRSRMLDQESNRIKAEHWYK